MSLKAFSVSVYFFCLPGGCLGDRHGQLFHRYRK
jgi:hypothetical protein